MKVYIISNREDADNFMAWHESEVPIKKFVDCGALHVHADEFFSSHSKCIDKNDIVIVYIGLKNENHRSEFAKLDCIKGLRTLDAKSSDGIVHRKSLESHKNWGNFNFWLVGIPNKDYNKVVSENGINGINFTHCSSFDNIENYDSVFKKKQIDLLISGQMHQKFYPDRWRIFEAACKQSSYTTRMLPHPGYEKNKLAHPYIGENYVEFCKFFWTGAVGTGQADGLHMKFLEFAKSFTLPLGETPTYMPERISKLILKVGLGEEYEETNREISHVLSDKEKLKERIISYSEEIRKEYDVNVMVPRVYEKILRRDWDF